MSYDLYTSLLKMYEDFRPTDVGVHAKVDFSRAGLRKLCRQYALDTIAGEGSDFDRAVRVMDWLTAHVRHDGSCNPEGKRCAQTALEYAFDQPDKGVNCAWLATTLAECLLALGIAARPVYIMPFAPYDCDNHVITHLWLRETQQWVMLDPTMNAYAMDAEGHLLDVFSLRALLADQQEVIFCEALRYNGQPCNHREHRDYLAKDLFWFRIEENGAGSRMLTIAPEHYDAKKRNLLNIEYRIRLWGDAPWLQQWLKAEKKNKLVYCSPQEALKAP